MIEELSVTWLRPKEWDRPIELRLDQDLTIDGLTVPRGFVTDGNSVPFGLRWLFRPYGRMFVPAIFHDFLVRTGSIARTDADALYLVLGKREGVPAWTRYPMFAAVATYTRVLNFLGGLRNDPK